MDITHILRSVESVPVMDCLSSEHDPYIFDFSRNNQELKSIDLNDEQSFCNYIFSSIKDNGSEYGIGRYDENRTIYSRSDVFGTIRSVHLGIDIWTNAGEAVYCPMNGIVHSFADNARHGDYGPTIILRHDLGDIQLHTLYGHLSKESLENIETGMTFEKGQKIATLGAYDENLHWPPHLHFQLIMDMEGKFGDYPGVCREADRLHMLKNCPDPNLILRIPVLEKQDI